MSEPIPTVHLQISGDLPWIVLGWRTFEQYDDVDDELVAAYGPVSSEAAAQDVVKALEDTNVGAEYRFAVKPICPVRHEPAIPGPIATAV